MPVGYEAIRTLTPFDNVSTTGVVDNASQRPVNDSTK
jgi:hypothetical protein